MRALLLGVVASTAAIALPTPAVAVDPDQLGFVGTSGVTIHSGSGFSGRHDGDFRRHHRRHRGSDGVFIYDNDYQGDTAWRSDGFNDWWHDNPQRAYPRWMLSNQGCDRQWYQGNVLTC